MYLLANKAKGRYHERSVELFFIYDTYGSARGNYLFRRRMGLATDRKSPPLLSGAGLCHSPAETFSMGTENISYTLWIYILIVLITLFAVNTFVCTTDRVFSIVRNKSPWQMILPHIVHIGFLVALVGHLLGSTAGFKSPQNFILLGDQTAGPYERRA